MVTYHNRHLIGRPNWMVIRGEEAIRANSIEFHQSYGNERIRMCPYDGIRRVFLGIQWR